MGTTTMRVRTQARYRGLTVTLVGDVNAGLLAIAGYGTPQELAIAAITVKRRDSRLVYCVAGEHEWTASVTAIADAAVRARQARDSRRG